MIGYRKALHEEHFVCIDCETTGLDIQKDEIIEIAAAEFTLQEIVQRYESLVKPPIPIPAESIELHHITEAMVHESPPIADVVDFIVNIADSHIIIGHSIAFDLAMIDKNLERLGKTKRLSKNRQIDTVRLARLASGSASNKLEHLRKHFNIEEEGTHRAMGDVLVNIQLFKYLIHSFSSAEEIMKRLEKPILMLVMPLGKYRGMPFKDIPSKYLFWASKQQFDQDLSFSIEHELKRRKKGASFGESANPFKNLSL
ncbi:MAG: DNA polymerase III subunit epsilon [Chlamydiae bacterium RIFCSPHIGHO2_12_FULL_49_11]|nr:MAG: DNA polymerase III subunit epsilon [Chlamydiae bacterium RIFCSPHIGHO2_12_FULL_49_11]